MLVGNHSVWYDGDIIPVFYLVGQSSSHNTAAHLEETAFNSHVSHRPGGGLYPCSGGCKLRTMVPVISSAWYSWHLGTPKAQG